MGYYDIDDYIEEPRYPEIDELLDGVRYKIKKQLSNYVEMRKTTTCTRNLSIKVQIISPNSCFVRAFILYLQHNKKWRIYT